MYNMATLNDFLILDCVSSKILNLNIHKEARGGPMAYVEIFDLDQYIDINFLDSIKKEKLPQP